MTAPRKIDPNDPLAKQSATVDLSVLDDYMIYLQTLRSGADHAAAADALRVIDCLRFIKLNQDFIRYAYDNPQDGEIYRDAEDRAQHILRDCNGTAFYVVRNFSRQQYLDSLNRLVSEIECSIAMSRQQNKLLAFTQQFRYLPAAGNLESRTLKPILYFFSSLKATIVYDLDALFEVFLKQNQGLSGKEVLEAAKKYFEDYLNRPCREGFSVAVPLNWEKVLDYMQRKLGLVLPSESLPNDPLSLIKQETVVAKMFESDFLSKEPTAWPFLINQLADPNHNRPIPKHTKSRAERANYWNPRTNVRTHPRPLNLVRGQPKNPGDRGYGFTKKTSVTLIPRSGKITLFNSRAENQLGLMFNLKHCHLKDEKYIWPSNASSNRRDWLGGDVSRLLGGAVNRSVGLEGLKDILRKTENDTHGPLHNELLIGLSKEALTAIVVTQPNNLATRLNALRFQAYVQLKLHKRLPIVFITPSNSPRIYDIKAQLADIEFLMEDNRQRSHIHANRSSNIPHLLRAMDLQKMRDEIIDEIQQEPIILGRIEPFIKNCRDHLEVDLLQQLQQDKLAKYLNPDQKSQLLQIAIKRNFTKLTQKALELGATLEKSGTQSPNVLLECYQSGSQDMLSLLLGQLPRICDDSRVMLADTMIACLQDGYQDGYKTRTTLAKIIAAAKQCHYTLNQLQQASTKQLNFLTLALQQQPIHKLLIIYFLDVDFNFPLSSNAQARPLELALSMNRPDLVIYIINETLDDAIQRQLSYLKKIGCQLPVDYSHINKAKIRSILTDERKIELLVSAIQRMDDANVAIMLDNIDPSSLRCYQQAGTQNTILHLLLLREPCVQNLVAQLLRSGGYDPASQNTAGKTPLDIALDQKNYPLARDMLDKCRLNPTSEDYTELCHDYIPRFPYQYFSQNKQSLRQYFNYLSTEQKNNLIYDALTQHNSAEISAMLALDASFTSCFDGIRDSLQRDWSVDHFNVAQPVDAKSVLILNKIFEYQPNIRLQAVFLDHKKEYRDTAFTTLQQSIAADHGVEALKKLFWAREQTMFSQHRSTSRLATIGRTRTVIKIDHLIHQSLKQSRHEKVTLLQTPVQAATDNELIASIQCCQKLLTHELYRIKAKQAQGSFFSRMNQSELNTLTDLHSQISCKSSDAELLSNPENLHIFCVHLDGIANLAVLDKKIKNRLVEIKLACEARLLPVSGVLAEAPGFKYIRDLL